MPTDAPPETLETLLRALSRGEGGALERVVPLVYAELRLLASRQLRRLGGTPTVSTTVLVHEAYERLAVHGSLTIDDERHFFRLCARVMQQIIVDHARGRSAIKRGGDAGMRQFDEDCAPASEDDLEMLARLSQALAQLTALDPALAEMAELAWLAGLDSGEISRLTGLHQRQVQRDLKRARAWVSSALLA